MNTTSKNLVRATRLTFVCARLNTFLLLNITLASSSLREELNRPGMFGPTNPPSTTWDSSFDVVVLEFRRFLFFGIACRTLEQHL